MDTQAGIPSPLAARIAAAFPALAKAPPATLERLAAKSLHRRVLAGTVMFNERTPCTGFPLVLGGAVRVVQQYPNGRELQLYRVKPGESCLVSGSCLLGDTAYPASGFAEGEVELLIVPPTEFRSLVAEDEAFRAFVFSEFGERMATLMQLVEAIAYQKLDQRLAALLVERGSGGSTTVQATHQALADDLGSVREIVTRLLRSFEDRGFVELGRERITLRDPAALTALARG
jgi:CRP/FNR family transcriptional regulator